MRILFCVVWCCVCWYSPTHSQRRINLRATNSIENTTLFEYKWFEQKLDHLDPTNKITWNQRYLVNNNYYKIGGPVFLLIEGEVALSYNSIINDTWIDYAMELNAICFYLEHRFYAQSRPTKDRSTKNLEHMSIYQALADTAGFIANIGKEYDIPRKTKVVVFGGSYTGYLAAMMRLKYPHLVHLAVASSATMLNEVDYKGYEDGMVDILATYSPECVSQIKQANYVLNNLVKTDMGANTVYEKFKLCKPFDKDNEKDVMSIFDNLSEYIRAIVQFQSAWSLTTEDVCDTMTNKSIKNSLDRYAAVYITILTKMNWTCYDISYKDSIEDYTNISWTTADEMERQYFYQSCTERGLFKISNDVFGNQVNIKYFTNMCAEVFGESYNLELFSKMVERTNMMSGALNITATRVIYVQGSNDPWKRFQVTHKKIKNTEFIYIKGNGHCDDMGTPSSTDTPQLKKARKRILAALRIFLAQNDFIDSHDNI